MSVGQSAPNPAIIRFRARMEDHMRTHAYKMLITSLGLAVLAGCSDAADHNAADVTFATDMIPHHQQAVQMAELATDRAASPEVLEVAEEIRGAQQPEIDTMSEWLEEWGEPVPEDMGGMDDGSGGMGNMPGMLTDEQLADLDAADGPAFDEMFLEAMIDHHIGAIQMAQTEQQDGAFADAIDLAEQIEQAQTEEIDRMRALLADDE